TSSAKCSSAFLLFFACVVFLDFSTVFSRPFCHTLLLLFSISSNALSESTDLSFLVISDLLANSSLCLIRSQPFSPIPCVFTSAYSPFSLCPCSRILSDPL